MKKDIHPKWHEDAKITCACGYSFTAGSTKQSLRVDICSHCHPFFTGKMKFIDTMGRVEKFKSKEKHADKHKKTIETKKKKEAERDTRLRQQKSLKEMLMDMK